jgi:hypothetical protein
MCHVHLEWMVIRNVASWSHFTQPQIEYKAQ